MTTRIPFFPEMEPPPRAPRSYRPRGASGDRPGKAPAVAPCEGCPFNDGRPKIPPTVPTGRPLIAAIGMRPASEEERQGRHFAGAGSRPILEEMQRNGVDLDQVFFANLTRCNPREVGYDDSAWETAVKKCGKFLKEDLKAIPGVPLVLFGRETLRAFLGKKERIEARRGLWTLCDERPTFIARHPARDKDNTFLQEEFRGDMKRMADKVFGRVPRPDINVLVYESPDAARPFLERLASAAGPWAFDIESYDAKAFPSRKFVSTDPCHPDFRLRGIAVAWGPNNGAWIDCRGWEGRLAEARELLEPAFGSSAEKWAFNGGFDDDGLVYPGWVPIVANRTGDGMLAMVALGDGTHASLRLEKAVVEVLKQPQYWMDVDKGKMRDIPLQECAENAVGDACYTWRLCDDLHGRLERGAYMVGTDNIEGKKEYVR